MVVGRVHGSCCLPSKMKLPQSALRCKETPLKSAADVSPTIPAAVSGTHFVALIDLFFFF